MCLSLPANYTSLHIRTAKPPPWTPLTLSLPLALVSKICVLVLVVSSLQFYTIFRKDDRALQYCYSPAWK